MALYKIYNFAMPTTAAPTLVTTGTVIKTMLQVKPSATIVSRIVEWGYWLDSSAVSVSAKIELIEVDVAATVTAHVAAGLVKFDALALLGGDPTTNLIQVGTTATGYTASAEGTVTASRLIDIALANTGTTFVVGQWVQVPLGREGILQVNQFGRIRVTFGTAVNMACYMLLEI